MKLILSKAKVHLFLILSYATQSAFASQQLRSRDLVAFDEDCTAVILETTEDTRSLVCETSAGLIYHISQADDHFITENFENGPFVSGETDVTFSGGGAQMNRSTNSISNSIEDLVLKKKKSIPGSKLASVIGTRTVLVVRVIATNDSTTANEATLSDGVFGTSGDPVNLKSQYAACSRDQLIFNKANDRTGNTGRKISNGVTTMNVNVSTGDGDSAMRSAITNALNTEFGVTNPNQLANHVMYCYPPNTMSGIAYAYINSWNSVYSDNWCGYVSVQLHEIGHNINLAHSNEGGSTYADQSGMMGYSYSQSNTPKMCFNAAKSWQLRWYQNRHNQVNIDTAVPGAVLYNGELAYFNDGIVSSPGPPMIIKLNRASSVDFYMFFNRKVDFNEGTVEGGNQVLIVSQGGEGNGYAESDLLAKLSAGGTWTESSSNTVVEVTSIGTRANVKICKQFCSYVFVPSASPSTPSPTKFPTSRFPTTKSPMTRFPTTRFPTTRFPTTRPPTTRPPTTRPPTTKRPTTRPPTTRPPTTKRPTTRFPTSFPTSFPTDPPVATCDDPTLKFKFKKSDGDLISSFKDCSWVGSNKEKRCGVKANRITCPKTCSKCHVCKDSPLKFKIEKKKKDCKWVKEKKAARCKSAAVVNACRDTCNAC